LNWLDIALVAIIGLSVVGGFVKGSARLVVGTAAAILGLLCGLWFGGTAGAFLVPYVSHQGIANFLGFLLVLFGVLILGALLGKLLSVMLKWVGLSWLDRLLGAVFGLVRGLVFAIALMLALMAFSRQPPPRAVVQSRLAPYVIDAARLCAYLAPRQVKDAVRESYEKVRKTWAEAAGKQRTI
jgi:membrane protein required for colicin V production